MKPTHDFIAARPLARHCEALMTHGGESEEEHDHSDEDTARFIGTVCSELREALAPLLVGRKPQVRADEPVRETGTFLLRNIGRKSASFGVSLPDSGTRLLIAFDLLTAVGLTDRLFGGDGKIPEEEPSALALSASLALERIAEAVGIVFPNGKRSIDADSEPAPDAADDPNSDLNSSRQSGPTVEQAPKDEQEKPQITHDSDATRVAPFLGLKPCISWTVHVEQDGFEAWTFQIVLLESTLATVVQAANPTNPDEETPSLPDLMEQRPFDGIPIEAKAILAEMKLPVARVAAIAPGVILALNPRRDVPLQIGDKTIAHGNIGTHDGQVALQLTSLN